MRQVPGYTPHTLCDTTTHKLKMMVSLCPMPCMEIPS